MAPKSSPSNVDAYTFIDDLVEGKDGKLKVMICWKWDVRNIFGKYMSTDFIVSDSKGSTIHCTALGITFYFLKVQEGSIYMMRKFNVQPSSDVYRILKNNAYIIILDGATRMTKIESAPDGFLRHPFELIEFGDLGPTVFAQSTVGTTLLVVEGSARRTFQGSMASSGVIPYALQELVNNNYILETKSHTYYSCESYESFTCTSICPIPAKKTPDEPPKIALDEEGEEQPLKRKRTDSAISGAKRNDNLQVPSGSRQAKNAAVQD